MIIPRNPIAALIAVCHSFNGVIAFPSSLLPVDTMMQPID
jgi:hypothetical protein